MAAKKKVVKKKSTHKYAIGKTTKGKEYARTPSGQTETDAWTVARSKALNTAKPGESMADIDKRAKAMMKKKPSKKKTKKK